MAWLSLLVQFIGKLLLSVLLNLFVVMLETLILVSVMFRVFYAVLHMIISICNATSVLSLMIPLLRTMTSDNAASVTVAV